MNHLAFGGYWFYGAANAEEMASTFASYGLISDVPSPGQSLLRSLWNMGMTMLLGRTSVVP